MSKTELQELRLREPDKTACWKIFNWPFSCQVKSSDNFDHNYYNTVGYLTTKNSDWSESAREAYMDKYMTIDEMVEYTREGKTFVIEKPHHACIVYELIKQHMLDWKWAVENSPHMPSPPMEDFRVMDELLVVTWRIAKNYITEQEGLSALRTVFAGLLGRNSVKVINPKVDTGPNRISDAIIRATKKR